MSASKVHDFVRGVVIEKYRMDPGVAAEVSCTCVRGVLYCGALYSAGSTTQ